MKEFWASSSSMFPHNLICRAGLLDVSLSFTPIYMEWMLQNGKQTKLNFPFVGEMIPQINQD